MGWGASVLIALLLAQGALPAAGHGPMTASAYVDWVLPPAPVGDSTYGGAVAIEGGTLVVGSSGYNSPFARSGAVYFFQRQADQTWSQTQFAQPGQRFGAYVGNQLALDGDRILVSAVGHSAAGNYAGAVHVMERDGTGTWTLRASLYASNPSTSALFGVRVALDGDTAVVGDSIGQVYVFERQANGSWHQTAMFSGAAYASGVALEGNTLVAAGNNSQLTVLQRSGSAWTPMAALAGGPSVALENGWLVSGASGGSYVYHLVGSSWAQDARLTCTATRFIAIAQGTVLCGSQVWVRGATAWSKRADVAQVGHATLDSGDIDHGAVVLGYGHDSTWGYLTGSAVVITPALYKEASATGLSVALTNPTGVPALDVPTVRLADTGVLWTGDRAPQQADASEPAQVVGPVDAAGFESTARVEPAAASASSTMVRVTIAVPDGPVIGLRGIATQASATCASASATVRIAEVTVDGQIVAGGAEPIPPNTAVPITGVGVLMLNEQASHGDSGLQVRAAHLQGPGLDVAVASSLASLERCDRIW